MVKLRTFGTPEQNDTWCLDRNSGGVTYFNLFPSSLSLLTIHSRALLHFQQLTKQTCCLHAVTFEKTEGENEDQKDGAEMLARDMVGERVLNMVLIGFAEAYYW